ncbi:MAG: gamma-glutamylcyclotransferase [Betaproteobacteria bacterium]|nr:gamma-glutamylcyclotransferase [Betaproteobacteria bacterium]
MTLDRFAARLPAGDLWIFGYGSLMWNPGFHYLRKHPARLFGFHRALCIHSTDHRGTTKQPGLVMGLAHGGSCHGMAFLVPREQVAVTLLELWQREMRNRSYHPRLLDVRIGSQAVRALAFTVDRMHKHYAGNLPAAEIARRVVACRGQRGSNIEYVLNTVSHLRSLGVRDGHLAAVLSAVRTLDAKSERPKAESAMFAEASWADER